MIFTSAEFLVFFVITIGVLCFLQNEAKRTILIICSAVFYGFWDWRFLFLLYFSVLFNFFIYRKLVSEAPEGSRKYVRFGVAVNLAVLGVFKYNDFFFHSLYDLLKLGGIHISEFSSLNIILPVGISFFTFQAISFIVDTFRGQVERNISLKELTLYITLFPQLVAGPIVRAERLLPQIRNPHPINLPTLVKGSSQMIWGFFLKLCLANNASPIADVAFNNAALVNSSKSLLGALAFTVQIFGDFAGYSLIAIGIGTLLGYDFGVNFKNPYTSKSFSDFWQRWHISLSSWLRDYLYIPLGGNRGTSLSTFRNLSVTMFLGGLWHGASYTFVFWGVLHGAFLCIERALGLNHISMKKKGKATWHLVGLFYRLVVFVGVVFAWIFFRAKDFSAAIYLLQSISDVNVLTFFRGLIDPAYMRLFGALLIYYVLQKFRVSRSLEGFDSALHPAIAVILLSVLGVCILVLGNFSGQTFIYFQF